VRENSHFEKPEQRAPLLCAWNGMFEGRSIVVVSALLKFQFFVSNKREYIE
jgi:hypothetical protein